jgi:hypothetical protein
MEAVIVDATPRKVQLRQKCGTNLLYWRKRDEVRPVGGIQPGVPIEIKDMGGWFTTEIVSVIDAKHIYLDDVGESGYFLNDPVDVSTLQFRLLGRTYSFDKQGVPIKGTCIQVCYFLLIEF